MYMYIYKTPIKILCIIANNFYVPADDINLASETGDMF